MGALKNSDSGLALLPYNPSLRNKLDSVDKKKVFNEYNKMMADYNKE